MLSFSFSTSFFTSLFASNYYDFDNGTNLEKNDMNALFRGKPYDFELNDFYDDEDLDKVWTGAKFQTEAFNDTTLAWSGVVNNDTVAPVNNTETQYGTSSGHYEGTYSFEDDVIGTDPPSDWTFAGLDNGIAEIIASEDGHKKVIHLNAITLVGNGLYVYNIDPLNKASGIMEFWMKCKDDASSNIRLWFQGSGGRMAIYWGETYLGYYDGSMNYIEMENQLDNIWHHWKIVWDCTTDWSLYRDGILLGSGYAFHGTPTDLDTHQFYAVCYGTESNCWIDAISYYWDPGYTPYKHHPGTYSFTNEIGLENNAISMVDTAYDNGDIIVIAEETGHNAVIEVRDSAGVGTGFYHHWDGGVRDTGIIEYWFITEDSSIATELTLRESGAPKVSFSVSASGYFYYAGNLVECVSDTWYHIKIQWYADETVDIWIDGVKYVDGGALTNSWVSGLTSTWVRMYSTGVAFHIDAYGESWDPYYSVGDNLNVSMGNIYPDNIIMDKGSYDYTNNMKSNDASYTTFTSTHTDGYIYETPSQWDNFTFTEGIGDTIGELETIDADWSVINSTKGVFVPNEYISSITYTKGSDGGGNLENTQTDDENYQRINPKSTYYGNPIFDTKYETEITFIIDPAYGGRDFYFSCDIWTSGSMSLTLSYNGGTIGTGELIDLDDEFLTAVTYIKLMGNRWTTNYYTLVKYFKLVEDATGTPAELDVQVDVQVNDPDLNSIEFFKYSHKTNVSIDIDLDIWNWVTTTWYEIESVDNSASFDDDSFALGSDSVYVSGTNQVRMRFQASSSINDFELLIDRFRLDYFNDPAELEMAITFPFARYNEDLLAMNVQSWQKTNISQTITFKIWNYDTESYVQISSSSDTSFTKKEYNTESPGNFISSSGIVKLYWNGSDLTDDFELHVDYLLVQIYYKLNLVHTKSFDTNGIYRYRWVVLGSIHYTQWVNFEVIDPPPNFYAISESELTTRWILQNATLTPVEDFHDDINTDYWDLVDVNNPFFTAYMDELYLFNNRTLISCNYTGTYWDPTGTPNDEPEGITFDGTYFWLSDFNDNEIYKYTSAGVYVSSFDTNIETSESTGITWDGTNLWVLDRIDDEVYEYTTSGVYTGEHFDISSESDSAKEITWDGTYFWIVDNSLAEVFQYNSTGDYTGTHFDISSEMPTSAYGIAWDGISLWVMHAETDEVYEYNSTGDYTGVHFDTRGEGGNPYAIGWDGDSFWVVMRADTEVYQYKPYYNTSKNYFGDNYMYIQTDTTELISLKSIDYTTHYNLSSGDYFEVDFQTSSDSQINLILLNNSVVQKTLVLSASGNTNFDRHTIKISVDEFVEFDQLKISSTFEDEDYVKVYDVKTYKYTLTGDHADFLVGSKRDREVYLTPDTYNLRILEEGDEKINENVTIPEIGVKDYVYTPTETLQCRLTLFNTIDESLDFMDYHIKVNRSLNDVYNEFWLLDSIFSVDKETYVYITVYDRFDTLIDIFERLASEYIDLELEVYSLQIKNLMTEKTTLDINGSIPTYPLLSGDSIYFMLSMAYYQIGYYDTNDVYKQFTIYLNSNQAYELNRSKICFLSYADQQGNHLFFENYKTYLNGSLLYENMFYREIGDIIGIEIKDRYGISVKNETYTVISGDNYIPITLTMYSLKVFNQQENFNWINITRDPNYYESEMYWSEWIAPTEIIEFKLFAGKYVINLTNYENGGSSSYEYTLNGDDVILITSGNLLSQVIYNIANVNSTIGNQITAIYINITNQNSNINNTIVSIEINIESMNSSLGNLLTDIDLNIININNNISALYTFTENNFLNLGNNINNSFTLIENNIIAINQTISTLVIGLDGKITVVNATITTMFTEMNSQFVVVQSTLDFSFAFLNQTIIQIGNNITTNQIALNNLIIQRANEIDNSLIQISTLVNLINSSVVNESLVIQSLVNIIGNNITENHIIINDLINLIGNNITENNIIMTDLIELVGNNITTNHFVIQTLIDYVSNNITDNHLEFLTNINLINNTIGQNQIELINRLLFINNSINDMAIDLTNQIILVNNTIYSAILDVSTLVNFTSDNILGNITLTYQQNDFLTELYKETMFSSLLNWSDVAFNYSIMEDRIDVWEFINNFEDDAIIVHLKYQDLIDNLTVSAQNTILQYLPNEDVEYRLWSIMYEKYLDVWKPLLPENKTVILGYFKLECRLDLFNVENEILDFMDYRVKVNYSLNGVYNEFNLTVPRFDVDKDTYIYISIYDEFDTLIDSFERLSSENIFLDIEVYQLQIKSFLEKETTIDINGSHTFSLLSGDSKYFMLSKAYYQIGYYDEENIYKNFVCYLDSNRVYELNSTYYDVYIGVFDTSGTLDWNDVKFYINNTRSDFGFNRLSSICVNLKVLDYFNSTLFNQNVFLTGLKEYSIYITLYSLKIKNEAQEIANYTIKLGVVEETGNILPQEIIEYQLATNNYIFEYTNQEDNSFGSISFILDEDKVYIINSTYYDVYFGLYNFYGIVNREEVKFYINGTRSDFGFNTIGTDYADLLVLDYFNSTLYHQIVRLKGLNEYSIYVEAYTLIVNNEYNTQSITVRITRGSITVERFIEAQGFTEFRLFPNTTYKLISYVNGTKDEEKDVVLDEEYKIVEFGFFEADVPTDPEPIVNTYIAYLIVVVFFAVLTFGAFKLYYGAKERKNEVPAELVNLTHEPHKKKQKGVVDNRL